MTGSTNGRNYQCCFIFFGQVYVIIWCQLKWWKNRTLSKLFDLSNNIPGRKCFQLQFYCAGCRLDTSYFNNCLKVSNNCVSPQSKCKPPKFPLKPLTRLLLHLHLSYAASLNIILCHYYCTVIFLLLGAPCFSRSTLWMRSSVIDDSSSLEMKDRKCPLFCLHK